MGTIILGTNVATTSWLHWSPVSWQWHACWYTHCAYCITFERGGGVNRYDYMSYWSYTAYSTSTTCFVSKWVCVANVENKASYYGFRNLQCFDPQPAIITCSHCTHNQCKHVQRTFLLNNKMCPFAYLSKTASVILALIQCNGMHTAQP